jgi:acyl dehydratase
MKKITFEPLTREQFRDYCQASGDWNKIHCDENFAKEAGLPSVIGHGMLSMGLAARALRELGFPTDQMKQFEAKFKDKTLPGDVLTAEIDDSDPTQIRLRILNATGSEILTGFAAFQ